MAAVSCTAISLYNISINSYGIFPRLFMSTTRSQTTAYKPLDLYVLPPCFPRVASLSIRSFVERGNMPYSEVTQPLPVPLKNRGTPFSILAVQITRVLPKEISTEPSAYLLMLRSSVTGLNHQRLVHHFFLAP